MADEELESEGDAGGLPDTRGTSPLVKILIIIAIICGAVIVMLVISYLVAKEVRSAEFKEHENIVITKAPPPLETWTFPEEFRINTADTETTHFVKMSVAFGYEKGQLGLQQELTDRLAQMRDLINLIVQGKTKRDLLSQRSLRQDIMSQINHILREGLIRDVWFKEFIVN